MPNYTPSQVYDKYVALQKQLATNITNKGVTASETELYDNLIDKVAKIENLKGEERTLENFTNVLSEPKSVVQLEYPEPKNLFNKDMSFTDANRVTDETAYITYFIQLQPNTQYYAKCFTPVTTSPYITILSSNKQVNASTIKGVMLAKESAGWLNENALTTNETGKLYVGILATGNVEALQQIVQNCNLQIEKGSTATDYEPYPAPKTLNAKLGSKNLIPYPYAETRTTIEGITVTYNSDNSIVFNGTATAQFWFKLFDNIPLHAGNYWLTGTPSGYGALKSFVYIYDSSGNAYNAYTTDGVLCALPADNYSGRIYVAAEQVFENVVFKPQLEYGSTATDYTPYTSDFSTVEVIRCGKNLIPYPYFTPTKTSSGVTFTVGLDGSVSVVGTATTNAVFLLVDQAKPITLNKGTNYTFSSNLTGSNLEGVSLIVQDIFYHQTITLITDTPQTFNALFEKYYMWIAVSKNKTVNAVFKPQLELGSTATEYESYQGQTYTPTTTGEVTGITNLYPLTNLITDNAGVVFEQITGEIYKTITPSTDKNGITKVLQPAVDSTIDSNIISDNIKQGVSILGVTGDYICNYTYDETSKELVLLI